jgi:hypothetical protein
MITATIGQRSRRASNRLRNRPISELRVGGDQAHHHAINFVLSVRYDLGDLAQARVLSRDRGKVRRR